MKAIRFSAILLACIATSAIAQTPQNILAALKTKYPSAIIKKLKHEQANYVAAFTDSGKKCKAFFDNKGTWLKTETALRWKTLPIRVKVSLVRSDYARWLVEDINRIDTPNGMMYCLEVDNEYTLDEEHQYAFIKVCNVYFTPSGHFIKEEDFD